MIRNLLALFLFIICFNGTSQVVIRGMAYSYPNQKISVFHVDDLISNHETMVAESQIDARGYFIFPIEITEIQKYILRINSIYMWMYLQPNGLYTIEIPENDESNEEITYSKEIEITLIDLDSNDINYKILGFQAWMDRYISDIYYTKDSDHGNFIRKIRAFKDETELVYAKDTCTFFRDFLKYSIGQNIDNLQFLGAPSSNDKYDFYLNKQDILYLNDAYMDFFKSFYEKYLFQLNGSTTMNVYAAIASSDLTLTNALLKEDNYLKEDQLRELVLLNLLREEYYGSYLPKSGILNLLTQISLNTKYIEHQQIASNLLDIFNTVAVGYRFPELKLNDTKDSILLSSIKGKYIYFHAFDPKNINCLAEIGAIKKLYDKYGQQIEFITIYPKIDEPYTKIEQRNLDALNWKKSSFKMSDPIWKKLQIISFPYYMLIDDTYHLVSSPALSPTPNGKYETIEKTLYNLVHLNDQE